MDIINAGKQNERSIEDAGFSYITAENITIDLKDGKTVIHGTVGIDADKRDCYKFTVSETHSIIIKLSGVTASLFLELFDEDGRRRDFAGVNDNIEDVIFRPYLTSGKIYNLYVTPFKYGTNSPYKIEIDMLKIKPVVADPIVEDPVVEDPVVEDPVVEDPVVEDPVVAEPRNPSTDITIYQSIITQMEKGIKALELLRSINSIYALPLDMQAKIKNLI